MAEQNAPAELTTPWGDILFNVDLGDGSMYLHGTVTGLDRMAPRRTPSRTRPQTHGKIWHDFLRDSRHPLFEGTLVVGPGSAWEQLVRRNEMEENLSLALDSIALEKEETGTYTFTPAGLTARSLVVRCDIPATFPGKLIKEYMFGLMAADPDFS